MTKRDPWCPWASVKNNGDFITVKTWSGYRMQCADPSGVEIFLKPDVDDITLGQAVLDALSASRIIDPNHPEWDTFFDYERGTVSYKAWVQDLMTRFGYKTKRALFRKMHSCSIEIWNEKMTLSPTHHEKLEGWGREKNDSIEDVIISATSSPKDIGVALRLAFSRCTGEF